MEVTPADWTILMISFIYLWQGIWLFYSIVLICRKVGDGHHYCVFPVLPPILYVVFSFSLACNVAWLLIWDKKYMEVALIFINLTTVTLYICLMVSMRRLGDHDSAMCRHNLIQDIWVIRILVQNGIGFYAAWATIAAIFNFAVVLTYRTDLMGKAVGKEIGSTVSLIVFTMEILAWFILDNFVFERAMRYLFTPYIATLISLSGIMSKNWEITSRNSIYTLTLTTATFILTVVKIVLASWRHYHRPIYTTNMQKYRQPVVSFEVRIAMLLRNMF